MVAALDDALALAEITGRERALLCSPAAPIVLLKARARLAPAVAPDNPYLGIMLPTTPLHHLLLERLGCPVVATSGNHGDEPIVSDEWQALQVLGALADVFLVHDRPILRPVDDSVLRVIDEQEIVLRCARGYAPLTISLGGNPASEPSPGSDQDQSGNVCQAAWLALGGHHKNAIALIHADRLVLGPHVGDLDTPATRLAYGRMLDGFTQLHGMEVTGVVCDRHPDYYCTQLAARCPHPTLAVPHHLAHVLACMLDNGLCGPVLGVVWDGSGYGQDGTLWGGEWLRVEQDRAQRVAHLWPFRLPGGESAIREPWRSALGVWQAMGGAATEALAELESYGACSSQAGRTVWQMLERGINAPATSSMGRLFDAVASWLGLMQSSSFEGEAAMALEFAAERAETAFALPIPEIVAVSPIANPEAPWRIDWRPTLRALIVARQAGIAPSTLANAFHEAMSAAIVEVARRCGIAQVALTGGCFQNARLTQSAMRRLSAAGFQPYRHHRIPPNDGGLAAGQARGALA